MGTRAVKKSQITDSQVEWQDSIIVADGSTDTNAEAGKGYLIDSTSAVHTLNLPSSPKVADVIAIMDVAGSAPTYNITINRNGNKLLGQSTNIALNTSNESVVLVYTGDTYGWQKSAVNAGTKYISATGGTITSSGDFRYHVFTGDGCFVVSETATAGDDNAVEYLVVAGGGSGGTRAAGGGGGGGFRMSLSSTPTTNPLNAPGGHTVSAQTYPITVGAGGTGNPPSSQETPGSRGSDSVFSTITSTGGGGGLGNICGDNSPGGSGGGGAPGTYPTGGSGNTPPVSPAQGTDGGDSGVLYNGGGGGGAGSAGQDAGPTPGNPTSGGGDGGTGSYLPSPWLGPLAPTTGESGPAGRYFSGGGGGGAWPGPNPGPKGDGGTGGGACGVGSNEAPSYPSYQANSGTSNTGGGGGGAGGGPVSNPTGTALIGGNGGSGIVIIKYKYK